MSTHALIGVMERNGFITAIYCHSDGYPSWVGKMLIEHYNDEESAREIVTLGDISCLKSKLHPRPEFPHGFDADERQPDVTVAYHRDRGEPFDQLNCRHISELHSTVDAGFCSYIYLFDMGVGKGGRWMVWDKYYKCPEWSPETARNTPPVYYDRPYRLLTKKLIKESV